VRSGSEQEKVATPLRTSGLAPWPVFRTFGHGLRARSIDYRPAVPSVRFKLSTGDWYSREVGSEEAGVEQVKRFFDRQEDYLRDWIRVDGNAWIARSAVVAVEVRGDTEPQRDSQTDAG
jgi:hypothetical protein